MRKRILYRMKNVLDYVTFRFGTIIGPSPGMRFHTAVNKFCWQAAIGEPLTVWKTAMNQVRPYLFLFDAIKAIRIAIGEKLWEDTVYKTFNVVSANFVLNDIIETIHKYIPDLKVKLVDHPIMNQQSYGASTALLSSWTPWIPGCFDPRGNTEEKEKQFLDMRIRATLRWLKPIIRKGRGVFYD